MARGWTRKQYGQRVMDIENKYEPLMMYWRRFAMGHDGGWHREIHFTPLGQRVEGFKNAFSMIGVQTTREGAIKVLQESIDEPSLSNYFKQPLQLVLEDIATDVVAPLSLQALLS